MSSITLAEARLRIAEDMLDDPQNVRWSTTQLDRHLQTALDRCLRDYAEGGGSQFDEVVEVTTTAGVADLSSYDPILIRSVRARSSSGDSAAFALRESSVRDGAIPDDTSRTLSVALVRSRTLPTDTAHPLVGDGATAANSWSSFDAWVCARAALLASVKDDDLTPSLQVVEADARRSVLDREEAQAFNPPRLSPFRWLTFARIGHTVNLYLDAAGSRGWR